MNSNLILYKKREIDFHTYLVKEFDRVGNNTNDSNDDEYITILNNVNDLGPQDPDLFEEIDSRLGNEEGVSHIVLYLINKDGYGKDFFYGKDYQGGGSRRNKATPKSKAKPKAKPQHEDMTMKDIKELCKANLIKLSKVVEGKRVVYKKKELITKLKRKKLL